jgi:hypothetical protein
MGFLGKGFDLNQMVRFRLTQPKPAKAEPNNHTAAGTGTALTTMLSSSTAPKPNQNPLPSALNLPDSRFSQSPVPTGQKQPFT